MNNDRWKTSIHESAHAVVAVILGGECSHLVVHHDASGLAAIDHLSPTDHAIAVAAASEAEELLADIPSPKSLSPESFHIHTDISEPTPAEKLEVMAAKFPIHKSPTDEQVVAQFCIRGLESEPPERWCERYYFIHHIAARVVRDHKDAILRVAHELFTRGVLSKSEIQEAI